MNKINLFKSAGSFTEKQGRMDQPQDVSQKYLAVAKRKGLANPLTGLEDKRLRDPEALLKEGWGSMSEGKGERLFYYPGSADPDSAVQRYHLYTDEQGPYQARISTYNRRGRFFDAEIVQRSQDGSVCRFEQSA